MAKRDAGSVYGSQASGRSGNWAIGGGIAGSKQSNALRIADCGMRTAEWGMRSGRRAGGSRAIGQSGALAIRAASGAGFVERRISGGVEG